MKQGTLINRKAITIAALLFCTQIVAQESPSTTKANQHVLPSEDLRDVYNKEMLEILKGMKSLTEAVVNANWDEIARIGSAIQNSYFLDTELSMEQKNQLNTELPKKYKDLDYRFHHYAGMVAEGAQKRDIELVNYYIYKMNEICTTCHAQFVSERFTRFSKKPSTDKTEHPQP